MVPRLRVHHSELIANCSSTAGQVHSLLELLNLEVPAPDRKSTRLNSSHANISYAVFCLKKKNISPVLHLLPYLRVFAHRYVSHSLHPPPLHYILIVVPTSIRCPFPCTLLY